MKRVLVIGTGALGFAVGKKLIAQGEHVVFASRSGKLKAARKLHDGAVYECLKLDLLARQTEMATVPDGVTTLYYCAAPQYSRWREELVPMVASALNLAEALNATFIYADNLYAYGKSVGPLTEQCPFAAKGRKGRARKAALELVLGAHRRGRVRSAVVQASDFYGPGVDISILGEKFFSNLLRGKLAYCLGNIDKRHSFTFIDDFAGAMLAIAADPKTYGQVWIAPCADAVSVREAARIIADTRQLPAKLRVAPRWLFLLMGLFDKTVMELREIYYLYTDDFVVDSAKYQNYFKIKATSLQDGFRATAEGY